MMKRISGLLIIFLCLVSAMAQQGVVTGNKNQLQKRIEDLKGTYELRYLGGDRMQPMLPSNLAEIIEKNRKQNEINTLLVNENLQLIIYPANKIVPTKTNAVH